MVLFAAFLPSRNLSRWLAPVSALLLLLFVLSNDEPGFGHGHVLNAPLEAAISPGQRNVVSISPQSRSTLLTTFIPKSIMKSDSSASVSLIGPAVCDPITDDKVRFEIARFHTTKGDFDVQLRPDLAPAGVKHLTQMIEEGYWENISFFRVNQWITQFGCDERDARPQFNHLRTFTDAEKDLNPCGNKRWSLGTFAVLGGNQMLIVLQPNEQMGKNKKDAYNDPIDHPDGGPGPDQTKISSKGGTEYVIIACLFLLNLIVVASILLFYPQTA